MTVQNEKDEKKQLVVIYAPPGLTGHLVPAVELSKLLVAQGLNVTIVIGVEAEADQGAVARIAAANPLLSLHCLPAALVPAAAAAESFQAKVFELVRACNPDLRDFLRSASPAPAALLIDLFCSSALDIGTELGIPTYFFFISCISNVAFSLYQPVIHEQTTLSFRDLGGDPVHVPGLPPIPADHLVAALMDRDSFSYKLYLDLSRQLCNSQGVIVNSCLSLEPRAAQAIVSGLCTLPGRPTPPLYCVGPLVKPPKEEAGAGTGAEECLKWLDGQPKASVAFLCFGSMGQLGVKQMKQIAAGLEASGQRFLWAVPAAAAAGDEGDDGDELEHLLDDLVRRSSRGLVLLSWAPQRQVLAHGAVGGFVTHCGWNSVLESISAGVPMLAWPLYAEQRMNKVYLVEEMRLAAVMEGYDKGMVEAEEVAAKVAWLIESDSDEASRELRQRTQAAKLMAQEALSDHGESKAALVNLVTHLRGTNK